MVAPWIISHFPPHMVYVEPYGGAGSVLLQKPRAFAEVYNDLNSEVCVLFRVLRSPTLAAELERVLYLTPFARDEFNAAYAPVVERQSGSRHTLTGVSTETNINRLAVDDAVDYAVEIARRFVIRSLMGFGSSGTRTYRTGFRSKSWRQNRTGEKDWVNYPYAIKAFTERLRGVVIENRPALEVIDQQDGEDVLFYVDPPYVHSTRSERHIRWSSPYAFEMNDDDHTALAERLHAAMGAVVLSGYRSPLYEALYGEWARYDRPTHASASGGAIDRVESIWINPRGVMLHAQQRLDMDYERKDDLLHDPPVWEAGNAEQALGDA